MNFKPELADQVMAGKKTVTRRLVSDNPRSPWSSEGCALKVARAYAVCPGRGKNQIGKIAIVSVRRERDFSPVRIGLAEARREGFASMTGFRSTWHSLHGNLDAVDVWRIEFRVVPASDYPLWEGGNS
jgi:hypothetical protein